MMKTLRLFGVLVVSGLVFGSITGSCSKQEEKAEQVAAMETADQMQAAKEGREAAKAIVTRQWADTMQLQQAIVDARSKNSKYEMEGKNDCKASFDTAFFNTIRTVRPELADQLEASKKFKSAADSYAK